MRILQWLAGVAALIVGAVSLFSLFGGGAKNMSCEDLVSEAKKMSQSQPVQIRDITGVVETPQAGEKTESRCKGQAVLADGSKTDIYLRSYEEGDNVMVEYSPTAFQ